MTFKQLLKDNDMTAVRLAKKIGVNNQTVGNWIHGKTVPNISMGMAISKALGVPIHKVGECFSVIPTGNEKRRKRNDV